MARIGDRFFNCLRRYRRLLGRRHQQEYDEDATKDTSIEMADLGPARDIPLITVHDPDNRTISIRSVELVSKPPPLKPTKSNRATSPKRLSLPKTKVRS
ncbi:hypothetical protein CKAH01_00177 [Colletotrichum kahawae]|uniref:Uncharacterized protein n=1 Tax=Colletotrichum kahawae TaxID=34407 RepID=A0AAD9YXY4_COLKA|nr:hypothetical protein CKAH01_00177 [Colletotrichum kahawae]